MKVSEMKATLIRLASSKRAIGMALVTVMLFGVGDASAEFEPTTTQEPVATDTASPTPEPSPSQPGPPAGAGGGGNVNNEVVVINTVDGRSADRAGFGVARVTGSNVSNQNAAAATSSCDDCRTVAVAAQAVIIQRTDATTIAPKNYAIAVNQSCTSCETFAAAYQYVFTTDGLVRFDDGLAQKLSGLQGQIRAVAGNESLSFPEMEARIDGLVEQMWSLVRSELVAVGVQGTGRATKDTDETTEDTGGPSPSPSPSESPSASPTPTASDGAEVSPTPSETPSPAPEPSASGSPAPSG